MSKITIRPQGEADSMGNIRRAIAALRDGDELSFEKGVYHVYPEEAFVRYLFETVSSLGNKRICFFLQDKRGITLDGGGSEFIFHGRISPFLIQRCEDVSVKNFTVDFDRPFYSQGEILSADERGIELRIPEAFPFRVEDGALIFFGENWVQRPEDCVVMLQEFDPVTKAPAYNAETVLCRIGNGVKTDDDAPLEMTAFLAEDLGHGRVLLTGKKLFAATPGNILTVCHENRDNPCVLFDDCRGALVDNLFIRTCGSYGIVGQVTENLTIRNVKIMLDETSKGLVSSNADATHFIHCYGKLKIEDCVFENMLDDAGNIHGQFYEIAAVEDAHTLRLRCKLWGYNGINIYKPGNTLTAYRGKSIASLRTFTVRESHCLPEHDYRDILVTTEEETTGVEVGDFVENGDLMPSVEIRRVRTGRNRPRGFLIQTCKPVVIEDCDFYNSYFAINITSDTTYWYESGPVRDVLIQNNRFRDCNYLWGNAPIGISPEYEVTAAAPYYHHNIRILNNCFDIFTDAIVWACGVEGLRASGNVVHDTDSYPKRIHSGKYMLTNCSDCDLE